MSILITGANGQLGHCLKAISGAFKENIIFKNSSELDLTNTKDLEGFFETETPTYCINCAAYTNVEAAEEKFDKAELVNHIAVKHLAKLCKKYQTILIHISTDYVFDGKKNMAYLESDATNPINNYGLSKLNSEIAIKKHCTNYFILRTSWLYSQYHNNFFNFVKDKIESKTKAISITTEQIGTPTNANDLAEFIVYLVNTNSNTFGLFHFSNLGELTWYDFSLEIKKLYNSDLSINPVGFFKTKAQRPNYSVLDKTKLKNTFPDFHLKSWDKSLSDLVKLIE